MKVVLAGFTGLVGKLLVEQLVQNDNITIDALGRRTLPIASKSVVQHQADLEKWPQLVSSLHADVAVSAFGTTLRDAGSEEQFFAIDHDAVLAFARAARASGAKRFKLVSSVGAHAGSRNFYLSTKGKLETAIQQIGFDRVDIYRPGLLRGKRDGRLRPMERVAMLASPLLDRLIPKSLDHFRSINAATVASAITYSIADVEPGVFIHLNRAMERHLSA